MNSSLPSARKLRNHNGKTHIINIHMRPDFERILENDCTLQCFRNFANSQHVLESLDCLVDIKRYKQMVLKLYPQMNLEAMGGRRFSTLSNQSSNGSSSNYINHHSTRPSSPHSTTTTTTDGMTSPSSFRNVITSTPNGSQVENNINSPPTSPSSQSSVIDSCFTPSCASPKSVSKYGSFKKSFFSSFFSISKDYHHSSERELETMMDSPKELPELNNNTSFQHSSTNSNHHINTSDDMTNNKQESSRSVSRRSSLRKKRPPIQLEKTDSPSEVVTSEYFGKPNHDLSTYSRRDSMAGAALETNHSEDPKPFSLFDDATSITSYETSTSMSVRSPLSFFRISNQDHEKERQLQEKLYYFALQMVENYIKDGAPYGINVDGSTKRHIENHESLASMNRFTFDMDFMSKYNLFNRVELQLLLLIKGDVLPRFAQSELWQEFVLKNGKLADACCYPEDLQRVEQLKYRKADFLREFITNKDLEFSEMAAGDMSCLQHMLGSEDLSVFFSKGHQFVDTNEVGVGPFNLAKVIGFLDFPAEVVVAAQCSTYATKKFLPTTKFDQTLEGVEMPFLPHEYEVVDFSDESKKHIYPSWLTKFNVAFPKPFGMRTCYAAGYLERRQVSSCYKYLKKNGKMGSKKTTNSLFISVHVTTPVSKDRCHNIHLAVMNAGGFLNILAAMLYKQTVGKVSAQGQSNTIHEMNELKKDRYQNIEDGYNRAKHFLSLTLQRMGKTLGVDCPFPHSFDRLQRYADVR
ncbi:hypothetical protein C9374_008345 [Naegleria lovaniensis]|uniref:RGS domain-containing protein n=1 Tax=Naegleria lovaniensis TaxID=51637 RepID=A0AA88GEY1_NAELO|nr:uncharacterized protein C9374_008345 [Naegleria lovaniensis]KAG2378202.1 hypothetical protein C9374_008345 [Naegleria lovaniensis]